MSNWGVTSRAAAQDTSSAWQDAIKLIDSNSPADIIAAISKLEDLAREPKTQMPLEGWAALTICQLRQHSYQQAAKSLKRIDAQFPASQYPAHRGLLLRLKLDVALSLEDAAVAEATYKDLVRHLMAEQTDAADLKQSAHAIGSTFAMLTPERARSPITERVLKIGSDQALAVKTRGVSSAYQLAYEDAFERSALIAANLLAIEQQGLDAVRQDYETRLKELQAKLAEVAKQKELNSEVARNSREQLDQNKLDLRQIARDITAINFKLRQPTPGHPGPKRNAPPTLPPRYSIRVDEYEMQTQYEYVTQNGQQVRVPVTRNVRRPQYAIDRERDSIYNRMSNDYERAIRDYREYEASYIANLKSWMDADQQRRKELNIARAEAEAKRDRLVEASKSINTEKKDTAKELRLKRTAQEQEQFELNMLDMAISAARAGGPHLAFRPVNFEPIIWSQEKVLLQRN